MPSVFLLLTAASVGASGPQGPGLATVPGVAVDYYDVAGRDIPEIHRSLSKAAARDPISHSAVPATSSWWIAAAVKWNRTGARCVISDVRLDFSGKATIPRLVVQHDTPAPVIKAWNAYAADLERRQVEQLRFAYDRRASVEQAIRQSSCAGWQDAADAALTRLRQSQAAFVKQAAQSPPKLVEPAKD